MSNWKPIDSAPKDGTRILGASVIHYSLKQKLKIGGEVAVVRAYNDKWYGISFVKENGFNLNGITHWMPLPEPPEVNDV